MSDTAATADPLARLAAAVERPDEQPREATGADDRGANVGRLEELAGWLTRVHGGAAPASPTRPRLLVLADRLPARTAQVASDVGVTHRLVTGLPTDVRPDARPDALPEARPDARPEARPDARPDAATVAETGRVGGRNTAAGSAAASDASLAGVGSTPADGSATALDAIFAGAAMADAEVDGGADLLLLALPGPALQVPAAALVGLLTGSDASAVTATGQGDAAWIAACAAIRDAMRRARPALGDQPALLAAVGGPELAVATGLLLGAAARRTPVLLDGPASTAAALVAARIAFRAPDWWRAAHLSPDPAHRLALGRLSLEPLLEIGLRGDDGIGALLAVPLLRAAALSVSTGD